VIGKTGPGGDNMDVRLPEEISTCHIPDTNVISVTEYGVSLRSAPRKHFKTQDEESPRDNSENHY